MSLFKRIKIRRESKHELEPQEIFLDALSQNKEEEAGDPEKKIEVPISKKVLQGFYLFFSVMILIFFAQTIQLKIVDGQDYIELANQNKSIIYSINAQRGVIYDKEMNQMVFNKPAFDLICRKNELPDDKKEQARIFLEISRIINKDFGVIKNEIEEANTLTLTIAENIPHETLILLEAKLNEFPGFEIQNNSVREYKDGSDFAHIIGYKRKLDKMTGIEEIYNEFLQQKKGKLVVEEDAKRNIISKKIDFSPESGESIVLWLDSKLQVKTTEVLEKAIENSGAKGASAVVMDVNTGGVLSLVSLPSYDNNLFSQEMTSEEWEALNSDEKQPLVNRAASGTFATGSIIKPLIASAALQEGIISSGKDIDCHGELRIKNIYWPKQEPEAWIYHDWTTHGLTNIRKAIAESCNVFFFTIGGGTKDFEGLGVERIKQYLTLFGWGAKTNIDLLGEEQGFLPDREWKEGYFSNPEDKIWGRGDTYNLSIGQGFLSATPIQVATSFAAIANGGKLLEPHILWKVIDNSDNPYSIIKEVATKVVRDNFIDSKNLQVVREGMRQTVTGVNSPQASAVSLNSLPVKTAAKTGTAETGKTKNGKNLYHNWVTVFAPYANPEIVLTILIEDVPGTQVVVLPAAKEILQWYYGEKEPVDF